MPHMVLVRKALFSWPFWMRACPTLVWLCTGVSAQDPKTLDLTTPAPESRVAVGPGGGVDSSDPQAEFAVPLALVLNLGDSSGIPKYGPFRVEVQITNTGSATVTLPASRDYDILHQDGSNARRMANLALAFSGRAGGETHSVTEIVAVLCGTSSSPSSFVRVEPGGTIAVRLDAQIGRLRYLPEGRALLDQDEVRVGAVYWEYVLDEKEFAIANRSEKIGSDVRTVRWW